MEAEAFFFTREIELNPKPEDAGIFKVYVSIQMSGSFHPMPSFLFSCQDDRSLSDGLRKLKDLLDEAGITNHCADHAQSQLSRILVYTFSSVGKASDIAASVYMYVRVIPPQIEEAIQASLNETTNNIRITPASKLVVGSLPRKYKTNNKTFSSDFITCTICLEEIKDGERLVTLPCGHEFDDRCIVDWFETSHVCPLCRFELPCEEMN